MPGHESDNDMPATHDAQLVSHAAKAINALEDRLARVRASVNKTAESCESYRKSKKWSRAKQKMMDVEAQHRTVLRLLGELDAAVIAWHGELLYAIDEDDLAALGGGDDKDDD